MSSMEALMERIRSRVDLSKTLLDTAKTVRIGLADKRHSLDIEDKEIYRSCLDKLQASITVRTTSGLMEKLETIARQMNLESIQNCQPPVNHLFIHSEVFYIDVVIDNNGMVMSVSIHHQSNHPAKGGVSYVQNCPEIVECLKNKDFDLFVKHLEGLNAVYNCGLTEKSRAWQVLYNMEEDVARLYKAQQQSHSWPNDINQIIHKTRYGLVEERAGGLPMKLRIFLAPFQLIDEKNKKLYTLNESTLITKDLGLALSVGIESCNTEHILPLTQAISSKGEELNLGTQNCASMPAYFILSAGKPIPLSTATIDHIVNRTGVNFGEDSELASVFSLISRQESQGSLDSRNNRGLFVTLPDQHHCYFLADTEQITDARLVKAIPFRHPSQVGDIVDAVRRQAIFNSLIASCVRLNSLEDVDTSTMFEITCLDPFCQSLTIGFEHEDDLATVEINLVDVTQPRCTVFLKNKGIDDSMDRLQTGATRILCKSLSIPITMRYILKNSKDPSLSKLVKTEFDSGNTGNESNYTGGNQNMHHSTSDNSKTGSESANNKSDASRSSSGNSGSLAGKVKKERSDYESKESHHSLSISRSSQGKMRPPGIPDSVKKIKTESGLIVRKTGGGQDVVPGISISRISSHDIKPKLSPQQSSKPVINKEDGIQPFVSITPIAGGGDSDHKIQNKSDNAGIEIIPLGGSGSSGDGQSKGKSRDYKRSLSEDDKRRMEKKEKRRREEMKSGEHRQVFKEKSHKSSNDNRSKDPKAKLAGVIQRLAHQTGDSVNIEIRPAQPEKDKSSGQKVSSHKQSSSSITIDASGYKIPKSSPKQVDKFYLDKLSSLPGGVVKKVESSPKDKFNLDKLSYLSGGVVKKTENSSGKKGESSDDKKSYSVNADVKIESSHKEVILKVGGEGGDGMMKGSGGGHDTISTKWMVYSNFQHWCFV